MSSNENNRFKNIGLFFSALCNMADLSKKMLKYSIPASFILIITGTALFVANKMSTNYSSVFEFTTTTLITNSFFVLAEFIIASLVIDILIKKK